MKKKEDNNKNIIAFFDFDHTISKSDSFLDFLINTFTKLELFQGLIFLFPVLCLYKLKLIPNWNAKESTLKYFFGGWAEEKFRGCASFYSKQIMHNIVRSTALEKVRGHIIKGHRVVVVSASLRSWLFGWCNDHGLELICTEAVSEDGKITGKLKTKNCWGPEKVRRIKEVINLEDYSYIYAYGDSAGDTEMLELANEGYFNWKKISRRER